MEKYSSEVQKIMTNCEAIAFRLGHSLVGSEHLLLAFLKNDNILSRELIKQKVSYDLIFEKVKDLYPHHQEEPMYMEYTIELKNVMEYASVISRQYHEEKISLNSLSVSLLMSVNTMSSEILKKMKIDTRHVGQFIQGKMNKKSELSNISDLHNLSELKADPLIGREDEMNQLIIALSRRNKPNAILVGEPGVGKTAIVEELAQRLKENKIPSLKNKMIYELDLASTVGGTKYRGEFEEKVKKILKKVIEDGNCILFIDEIHNIVKAGGAEGAIDASNIIKPYLSRGEIQIIGATTEDEFQNIFEKDKALKRRFQIIKVAPTSEAQTKDILQKIKPIYEDHYHLSIDDDVLDYIVDLTSHNLPNYYFPDKAIDVLDNACVIATKSLKKDEINKTLETYFKINVSTNYKNKSTIEKIKSKIFGQEKAIKKIGEVLSFVDHKIYDSDKPLLSLMFLGPSGVGKSEIAKIIGEMYFGRDNIIYLDMASYQEINALPKLIGTNYNGDNPKLVRDLKAHPKSLILLDEIEKANNEVLDFFLQVMDVGMFESAKGEKIDCSNTMIIMTSNYGFDSALSFSQNINRNEYQTESVILKKLHNRFRFEFLSRFDDIILFDYLTFDNRKKIAQEYLTSFELGIEFEDLGRFLNHSEEDYHRYGARLIKRDCKKAVLNYLEERQKTKN